MLKLQLCYLALLFLISLSLVSTRHIPESDLEVISAVLITRHGDRSPNRIFPNSKSIWPDGFGQLTYVGMNQHYKLGQKYRQRYTEKYQLFNETYVPGEVYVRSTPIDRTLMSAQSFMLGMFPPGTGHPSGLPHGIQPVPIFSLQREDDNVLYAYKNCPKMKELQKQFRQTQMYKDKENETAPLRQKLSDILGSKVELKDMMSLNTLLLCEQNHNHTHPHGITEAMKEKTKEIAHWLLKKKFHNREIGLLAGGMLPHEIHNIFEDQINGSKPRSKFVLFSAHDGTLLAFMAALGVTEWEIPPFAAHLLFELIKQKSTGQYFVRALYNDRVVSLPDCEAFCSFDKFTQLIRSSHHGPDWSDRCTGTPTNLWETINTHHLWKRWGKLGVGLVGGFILAQLFSIFTRSNRSTVSSNTKSKSRKSK